MPHPPSRGVPAPTTRVGAYFTEKKRENSPRAISNQKNLTETKNIFSGTVPLCKKFIFAAGIIPFGEDFLSVSISTVGTQQYEVEVRMQNYREVFFTGPP